MSGVVHQVDVLKFDLIVQLLLNASEHRIVDERARHVGVEGELLLVAHHLMLV